MSQLPTILDEVAELLPVRGRARLEQYCGPWAIEERAAEQLLGHCRSAELIRRHILSAADDAAPATASYTLDADGLAVIRIEGALTKYGSSLGSPLGTLELRRQVRAAAADPAVKAILLVIDSPGGAVAGVGDLADAVAAASRVKPVVAFAEDMAASAAYWVAASAGRVVANPSALVGSIGTFMVVEDWSAFYQAQGVRPIVIRAGEFKGAGTRGTQITAEQQADFARVVGELNGLFLAAVSAGRGLAGERLAAVSDGRVHVGAAAVALGLVDEIGDIETARAAAMAASASRGSGTSITRPIRAEENNMSSQKIKAQEPAGEPEQPQPETRTCPNCGAEMPATAKFCSACGSPMDGEKKQAEGQSKAEGKPAEQAASYAAIKAACPGADAEFIGAQCEAGATVQQAQAAWVAELNRRVEAASAKARKPGVEPVGSKGGPSAETGDPIVAYNVAVTNKVKAGMKQHDAVLAVNREQPELRAAYVAAYNAAKGRH